MITQIHLAIHHMQSSKKPPTTSDPSSHQAHRKSSVYKVPHRFDLATVFVVTFAYAAFFGSMRAVDAPTSVQAAIIGLLTAVGIVQMIVPERYVRFAAITCGCLAFAGLIVAFNLTVDQARPRGVPSCLLCAAILFGPLLGYCAGVVVAGVFLISDYVRRGFKRLFGFDGHQL